MNEGKKIKLKQCTPINNITIVVKKKEKKVKKKTPSNIIGLKVILNNSECKYKTIIGVAKKLDWFISNEKINSKNISWDIAWLDSGLHIDRIIKNMASFQKVNHFPGMVNIYRKNCLTRSMMKMQKIAGDKHYSFFPKSWVLPNQYNEVIRYMNANTNTAFIVKPSAGAQGKGIYLALNSQMISHKEDSIVQTYITRPLLVNGYKFDLRIYALITCCEPLRIFVYNEGLCRFCTAPYVMPNNKNLTNSYMHLTNYSINKKSDQFVHNNNNDDTNEEETSKRSLSWLWGWLEAQGHTEDKIEAVWRGICDVVVKTLISTSSSLKQAYRSSTANSENKTPFTCFELLGFDIILTESLKPCLLEVNHSPSYTADSKLDMEIKVPLIENIYKLLNISTKDRKHHVNRSSVLSQIRLYGESLQKFNKKDMKMYSDDNDVRIEQLWHNYLDNESNNLGNFDLAYPTEYYPNQPTNGKEKLYDSLIDKESENYFAELGIYSSEESEPIPECEDSPYLSNEMSGLILKRPATAPSSLRSSNSIKLNKECKNKEKNDIEYNNEILEELTELINKNNEYSNIQEKINEFDNNIKENNFMTDELLNMPLKNIHNQDIEYNSDNSINNNNFKNKKIKSPILSPLINSKSSPTIENKIVSIEPPILDDTPVLSTPVLSLPLSTNSEPLFCTNYNIEFAMDNLTIGQKIDQANINIIENNDINNNKKKNNKNNTNKDNNNYLIKKDLKDKFQSKKLNEYQQNLYEQQYEQHYNHEGDLIKLKDKSKINFPSPFYNPQESDLPICWGGGSIDLSTNNKLPSKVETKSLLSKSSYLSLLNDNTKPQHSSLLSFNNHNNNDDGINNNIYISKSKNKPIDELFSLSEFNLKPSPPFNSSPISSPSQKIRRQLNKEYSHDINNLKSSTTKTATTEFNSHVNDFDFNKFINNKKYSNNNNNNQQQQ
jgi:tubulin polyglutamylase TTLL6/13